MRKIVSISLLSNILIFATEKLQIDESMPWLFPWLLLSLLMVGLFFWGIYKAMKTKNPKYGYIIVLALLLMVGLLFI